MVFPWCGIHNHTLAKAHIMSSTTAAPFTISRDVERMLNGSTGLGIEGTLMGKQAAAPFAAQMMAITPETKVKAKKTTTISSGTEYAKDISVSPEVAKMLKGRTGFGMDGSTLPRTRGTSTAPSKAKNVSKEKKGKAADQEEDDADKTTRKGSFESGTTTTVAPSISSRTPLTASTSKAKSLFGKLVNK